MAHPLIGKYQKTAFDKLSADQRLEARQEIKDALAGKAGTKISQEDRVILMQRWIATFDNPAPQEDKPANEGKKRQFSLKLPRLKLPAIKLPAMKSRTEKKPAPEPAQKMLLSRLRKSLHPHSCRNRFQYRLCILLDRRWHMRALSAFCFWLSWLPDMQSRLSPCRAMASKSFRVFQPALT